MWHSKIRNVLALCVTTQNLARVANFLLPPHELLQRHLRQASKASKQHKGGEGSCWGPPGVAPEPASYRCRQTSPATSSATLCTHSTAAAADTAA